MNDCRLVWTSLGKQFSLQWHRPSLSLACLHSCVLYENTALRRKPALAQHAPDASALSQVAKVILSTKQYRI